ncbi:unnamed protein product [Protopolystoma xenopodis]|uniref:Uncharacterized protein n=1 Tax=Protopolystoma xenopodis TaxID=117903 RepID=A0A448WKT0_9PLAT|nr:unnamed protein product [Protopolystoma xenopodis]
MLEHANIYSLRALRRSHSTEPGVIAGRLTALLVAQPPSDQTNAKGDGPMADAVSHSEETAVAEAIVTSQERRPRSLSNEDLLVTKQRDSGYHHDLQLPPINLDQRPKTALNYLGTRWHDKSVHQDRHGTASQTHRIVPMTREACQKLESCESGNRMLV